jgi:ABC-type proline/glycine betaine transport system ATPase subunit
LQDELLDLQRDLKRTIIFVSHDLDEAFKIGNRIAIMEGGRIARPLRGAGLGSRGPRRSAPGRQRPRCGRRA